MSAFVTPNTLFVSHEDYMHGLVVTPDSPLFVSQFPQEEEQEEYVPDLVDPATPEEFRKSSRMPLDCAAQIIYAVAREVQAIMKTVEFYSRFHTIVRIPEAPEVHIHLLAVCLDNVVIYRTDDAGNADLNIDPDLHVFEGLFYAAIINLYMLYNDLLCVLWNGSMDPSTQLTENLTAEGMMRHLTYHWKALIDPELLATLDFAIRKERLVRFKADHNTSVFLNNHKYAKTYNEASINASIRNALNAVPFDEAQLTPDIPGLHPTMVVYFNPFELLRYLHKKNEVSLACWCEMNDVKPKYEIHDGSFSDLESELSESDFDMEDAFTINPPPVDIPEENIPTPVDTVQGLKRKFPWLSDPAPKKYPCNTVPKDPVFIDSGYAEESEYSTEWEEESDYDDDGMDTAPQPADPLQSGIGNYLNGNSQPPSGESAQEDPFSAYSETQSPTKKRARGVPAAIDAERSWDLPVRPAISPLTPEARPAKRLRPTSPDMVAPDVTAAQHTYDLKHNKDHVQKHRDRALAALCGEEVDDESDAESIHSDSDMFKAWEALTGQKKFW
ncbi:hypothetical protein SLS56_007214 [Neofusicoccum ribis]|uniref:Uncharacterized protein n=1 Tax=Neofusicoccum ribis TaxID=45134 RepID=A0ABR3SP43_9PEZI